MRGWRQAFGRHASKCSMCGVGDLAGQHLDPGKRLAKKDELITS